MTQPRITAPLLIGTLGALAIIIASAVVGWLVVDNLEAQNRSSHDAEILADAAAITRLSTTLSSNRAVPTNARMSPESMSHEARGDQEFIVGNGKRILINSPKIRYTPEERLADMDAEGTDVQVVSIHTPLFPYHWDTAEAIQASREVNDEIAGMTQRWPDRFAGLATLPVQDVDAAIAELERAVKVLGLKGAELDMVVNGLSWDEPQFLPLFKAAESLDALLFFHPQPQDNLVATDRTLKAASNGRIIILVIAIVGVVGTLYGLPNSVGVVMEDALVVATLICGGILDKCPNLKVCIAHGGGAIAEPASPWAGWTTDGRCARKRGGVNILKPPSAYQDQIYYDFLTSSEAGLRFLIDTVGADRVVIGSDWPFVGWDPSPGGWLEGLTSLTQEEKEQISWRNLEALLGI